MTENPNNASYASLCSMQRGQPCPLIGSGQVFTTRSCGGGCSGCHIPPPPTLPLTGRVLGSTTPMTLLLRRGPCTTKRRPRASAEPSNTDTSVSRYAKRSQSPWAPALALPALCPPGPHAVCPLADPRYFASGGEGTSWITIEQQRRDAPERKTSTNATGHRPATWSPLPQPELQHSHSSQNPAFAHTPPAPRGFKPQTCEGIACPRGRQA